MKDVKKIINNITFKQMLYPVLSGLYAIIVAVVFIVITTVLARDIDRVFIIDESQQDISIDREKYDIIAKKLSLPNLETTRVEPVTQSKHDLPYTQSAVATSSTAMVATSTATAVSEIASSSAVIIQIR